MLKDGRIATRLPAQDLERARAFYSEKLGLQPAEEREGGLRYGGAAGEFAQSTTCRAWRRSTASPTSRATTPARGPASARPGSATARATCSGSASPSRKADSYFKSPAASRA